MVLKGIIDNIASELDVHIAKEEKVLFPRLAAHMNAEVNPVSVMLAEHAQIRTLLKEFESALQKKNSDAITAIGHQFASFLTSHANKEDNVLFHLADTLLNEREKRIIAKELVNSREKISK